MSPTPQLADDNSDETTLQYKEILKSNGITDEVSEIIVRDAGLRGEGMASISKYVTVNYSNPKLKPLNLFVKAHSSNPSHTQMLEDLKAFEKEARFFMEYVPAAKEFCKSKGLDGFVDFYPKCYYGDEKIIVLENLVLDQGYALADKVKKQTLEEARFALTTLAKHHALGNALLQEYGGSEKFFEKFKNLDYEPFENDTTHAMFGPALENGLNTVIQLLEKNDVDMRDETLTLLKTNVGKVYDIVLNSLRYNKNEESLILLNHGDYWNNNMMFLKDKVTSKVIGHMAIDLQVTRYGPPALDLGYYLFTSVQSQVRQSHLEDLLKLYLEALRKHSKDLTHPINLSYDELFLQYRRKFELGFWMGVCICGEAAFVVLKDIDPEEMGDFSNMAAIMDKAIRIWLENNPDKGREMAIDMVGLVKEYKQLQLA